MMELAIRTVYSYLTHLQYEVWFVHYEPSNRLVRISTIFWALIIIIIAAGGGWYYYSSHMMAPASTTAQTDDSAQAPGPNGAAGINGSANQGNLGQPDSGVVQQPGADGAEGTVIGGNVSLGIGRNDTAGTFLIGYNGMTVYTFAKDKTASSTCYSQCAAIWPPYLLGPEDNAQNVKLGVDASKVGTATRTDGSIQMTYDGHPLYFYAQDQASGDSKGQGFNKVWYAVKP